MAARRPLVSVVVPTHRRPGLVARAVRSALGQTLEELEVIVVVDGADEPTMRALEPIRDERLRIVVLETPAGNAAARNAGVAGATATWIAFLDDDDLWEPAKLERQLRTAEQSPHPQPIVGCRLIARTESTDFVWPRRLPEPGEALCEYLFCRRSPLSGEGVMPTSVIFTSRSLLREVPFRSGLRKHVDLDWLFRASAREGVGIEFVPDPEPLAVWHIHERRRRISTGVDWRYSRSWIRSNRHLVTARAYASFLLTVASADAARAGEWRALPLLIAEAYRRGTPSLVDVTVHLTNYFVPQAVRGRIADTCARHHARRAAAAARKSATSDPES